MGSAEVGGSGGSGSTLVRVTLPCDEGWSFGESFRGNQRNAFQGICFAIVRATGPGTVSISASANGVSGTVSVDIASSEGRFVPCSGTCDQ